MDGQNNVMSAYLLWIEGVHMCVRCSTPAVMEYGVFRLQIVCTPIYPAYAGRDIAMRWVPSRKNQADRPSRRRASSHSHCITLPRPHSAPWTDGRHPPLPPELAVVCKYGAYGAYGGIEVLRRR